LILRELANASEIQKNIDRYHTIWLICLIAAICFLVVAIVLFIVFRIPKSFMIITGLSRKKEIKQLDANVAYTTQLSRRLGMSRGLKPKRDRKRGNAMITQSGRLGAPAGGVPVTQIDRDAEYADPRSVTTLLNDSPYEGMATTLLSQGSAENETSLLSGGHAVGPSISKEQLGFRVIQEILMVHTEEDILA